MISTIQLSNNLKSYIVTQIDKISNNIPIINLTKPLITRALNKKFSEVTKLLDLIADDNGNIDIENILPEMIGNIMNAEPFIFNTPFLGDIELGGGSIKLNIPLTDKKLVLGEEDLKALKELLISNV